MAVFDVQSLEAQKSSIKPLINTPLKINDTWYLIDSKWFKQWQKYVNYENQNTPVNSSDYPGPVDNSALFKDGSKRLKEGLMEGVDYDLVPENAWYLLLQWYSLTQGQDPIARKVINQGTYTDSLVVEVDTKDLKVFKYNSTDFKLISFSEADSIEDVEKTVKKVLGIAEKEEIRMWNRLSNILEPLSRMQSSIKEAFLGNGAEVVVEVRGADGAWPYNHNKVSNNTAAATKMGGGCTVEGSKTNYQRGLCGLSNLGNTCFMNSTLQCMSNVPALTNYMLSGKWKNELNTENPLGMRGEVASSYADLINNIWSGKFNCTAPRQFKVAVGRFKPEFSGYQQQDSQELMAFLLDGLHEDLNRIRKKPYIEHKEAENRPDEVVANETWRDYIKRNDSIITDTFHGLLKSTLVCPECQKVSIKFDPFCYLSLPLPVKRDRQIGVFFVSDDSVCRVKQFRVTVPKLGHIADVCKAISEVVNCKPQHMIVADVYNHRFHKVFTMHDSISGITDKDDIYVYQMPLMDPKNLDQVIVSVYLREIKDKAGTFTSHSNQLFGNPFFISVHRHQSCFDDVYNKITGKMRRYIRETPSKTSVVDASTPTSLPHNTSDAENADNPEESMEVNLDEKSSDYMDTNAGIHTSISTPNNSASNNASNNSNSSADDLDNTNNNNNKWQTKTSKHRMFQLHFINAYGSTDFERVPDNKTPIRFDGHAYIGSDWSSGSKKKYYNDKEADVREVDGSMDNRPAPRKGVGLGDCLDLFTTMEKLGEQDPWYCPSCKKHQQATKKFDLWKLPRILVIHLKRFSYNRYWRDKLDTLIEYPVEGLDMSRFLINNLHPPSTYDLISVSNHYGGLGGGHYTAYAKNHQQNRWYYFDDSCVTSCEPSHVVTKAGYVLVYELRNNNKSTNNNSPVDPDDEDDDEDDNTSNSSNQLPSYEESMETSG